MTNYKRCFTTLFVGLVLSSCSSPRAAQEVMPTPLPTTLVIQPTRVSSASPVPSATAQPTVAPTATLAPTPEPTAAPTATPEPTAVPTTTPEPSAVPTNTPAPAAITGLYVFPVQGKSIDYGKYHHDYPATDIFCATGSAFVAPTSGVVEFVSYKDVWNAATDNAEFRGGLSVAVIGDDGVRYYGSHLSEIAAGIEPGVRVATGDLLGRTGKSGNAASTPPHLHFGISHPTTPDDWQTRRGEVSPYPYLQAWARGENTTPVLQ